MRTYAFPSGITGSIDVTFTPHGPLTVGHQEMDLNWPLFAPNYSYQKFPEWYGLERVGASWKLKRDFVTPLAYVLNEEGVYWPTPANNWAYSDLSSWMFHYPRHEQCWISRRSVLHHIAEEPMATSTQSDYTTESPAFIRELSELKPFPTGNDAKRALIPLAQGFNDVNRKHGAIMKQQFYTKNNVLTRLAAWAFYQKLTFYTGPETTTEWDYTRGSAYSTGYYANARASLLANEPEPEDDQIGYNALPMQVEHFNLIAGLVNGSVDTLSRPYVSGIQSSLFPGVMENGFGSHGLRPRTQWASWRHDFSPHITTWFQAQGVPIKTAADFPSEWATMMAATQVFVWIAGGGPDMYTGTIIPGEEITHPLYEKWCPNADAIDTNYRWISIADAQALHASLKIPFTGPEGLAVPMRLKVVMGTPTMINGPGQLANNLPAPLNAAVWVNEADGDWVIDPDVIGRVGPIIRADVTQTDFVNPNFMYNGLGEDNVSVRIVFGNDVETRLYVTGDMGEYKSLVAQYIPGNRFYIYRRIGDGIPQARIVVWPRNYIDYERFTNKELAGHIPRIGKEDIENPTPTVFQTFAGTEITISTEYENAEITVWKVPRSLT